MASSVWVSAFSLILGAGPFYPGTGSAGPLQPEIQRSCCRGVSQLAADVVSAGNFKGFDAGPVETGLCPQQERSIPHPGKAARQNRFAVQGLRHPVPYNFKHVLSRSKITDNDRPAATLPTSSDCYRTPNQRRLSQIGIEAYADELARIRARHDYVRQTQAVGQTLTSPENTTSLLSVSQPPAGHFSRRQFIVQPPTDPSLRRIRDLEEQVRRQQLQIQTLQNPMQKVSVKTGRKLACSKKCTSSRKAAGRDNSFSVRASRFFGLRFTRRRAGNQHKKLQ